MAIQYTTRKYPYPDIAGGDTPDVPRDIKAIADRADAEYITAATFGALPAADPNKVGRKAYITGTGQVYLDIGTTWARLGGTDTLVSGDIGSTVQGYDADLAAFAALVSAANKIGYFTGAGTMSLTDLTAAGRALIDDADATAQRATLGLGSIATQAASAVAITGGAVTGITDVTVADGGTGASTAAAARTNLGTPTYSPEATVTSLPGSPVDGQEVYYLADATNGVVWHLKYRSASSSAYKWECVGGSELYSYQSGNTGYTNANLTALSPGATVPLAGDYEVEWGGAGNCNVANSYMVMYITYSNNVPTFPGCNWSAPTSGGDYNYRDAVRREKWTGMTASQAIQTKVTTASACFLGNAWLRVKPVRVG